MTISRQRRRIPISKMSKSKKYRVFFLKGIGRKGCEFPKDKQISFESDLIEDIQKEIITERKAFYEL